MLSTSKGTLSFFKLKYQGSFYRGRNVRFVASSKSVCFGVRKTWVASWSTVTSQTDLTSLGFYLLVCEMSIVGLIAKSKPEHGEREARKQRPHRPHHPGLAGRSDFILSAKGIHWKNINQELTRCDLFTF